MKKIAGISVLVIIMILLTGAILGNRQERVQVPDKTVSHTSDHYPTTVKTYDSENHPISMTFTEKPQRVVVHELNTLETLLVLGLGDRVVGTSVTPGGMTYKRLMQKYPDQMQKIMIRNMQELNTESVLASYPDAIIGWKSTFTAALKRNTQWWNDRGVKTYVAATSNHILNYGTIEDECQYLADMGNIFDMEDKTNQLIDEIHQEIQATREAVKGKPKQKVMVIEMSGRGAFMNYDEGWLVGDMVTSLGGYMPVKERRVGFEELLEQNPEVIFVVYFNESQKDTIRQLLRQPQFSSLQAVRKNRICLLPFDCMYTSEIKTIQGIRLIKEGLYPELKESGETV